MTPITTCSQRQPERTEAMKNSLIIATRNRTPSRTPTVGTEAGVNRSATKEMMSEARRVSRTIHHGPASRHSPARVLDRRAVLSSMALMAASFPHGCLFAAPSPLGGGPARLMITRLGKYDARREALSRMHPMRLPYLNHAPADGTGAGDGEVWRL